MVIALTPNQMREWSPSSERSLPADQRCTFLLRALPFSARTYFGAQMAAGPEAAGRATNFLVRVSLAGWRNLKDADGNDAKWATETVSVGGAPIAGVPTLATYELLGALDMAAVAELMNACLEGMGLSKDDVLS